MGRGVGIRKPEAGLPSPPFLLVIASENKAMGWKQVARDLVKGGAGTLQRVEVFVVVMGVP